MIEILSQIYDMFEDGASVEEVAKYFENLQSQLDIANKKLKEVKEYLSNYKEPLYIPDDLLKFLESIIGGE